jgi:cytochrome c-type biogenesis protein CcmH
MKPVLTALLLALAAPAVAALPGEALPDPAQEARARAISAELRCVVCQNQSIDDSDAPLARDLRLIVRERIAAGDDDAAVKRWVVERYGSYVLLRPPFDASTAALWAAPFVLALAGGWALTRALRRRTPAAPEPLSPEELGELERLRQPDTLRR